MRKSHNSFKEIRLVFERKEMSDIKYSLILICSMMMVRIGEGMRMNNNYPILYMRVGKATYSTPVAAE